jgi:putative hydrolase of the HAD superfamily
MKTRNEHIAIIRQLSQPVEPLATGESAVLKKLNNIEAVLFDVYGTLFVSSSGDLGSSPEDSHGKAFCEALADSDLVFSASGVTGVQCLHDNIRKSQESSKQQGVEYPEVDIVEVWRGTLKTLQAAGHLTGYSNKTDVATISLKFEMQTNPVWPMPGAAQCLTELSSRGVRLGLVSNGQWFSLLLFPSLLGGEIEAFGIAHELQYWSFTYGRAKPGDFLFREAAGALAARQIKPEYTLYVGNDMLNDILPASAIGFRTALFAGDRRSLRRRSDDPRVASVAPDIVANTLREVLQCVRPEAST